MMITVPMERTITPGSDMAGGPRVPAASQASLRPLRRTVVPDPVVGCPLVASNHVTSRMQTLWLQHALRLALWVERVKNNSRALVRRNS